jgi:hypothetical protein
MIWFLQLWQPLKTTWLQTNCVHVNTNYLGLYLLLFIAPAVGELVLFAIQESQSKKTISHFPYHDFHLSFYMWRHFLNKPRLDLKDTLVIFVCCTTVNLLVICILNTVMPVVEWTPTLRTIACVVSQLLSRGQASHCTGEVRCMFVCKHNWRNCRLLSLFEMIILRKPILSFGISADYFRIFWDNFQLMYSDCLVPFYDNISLLLWVHSGVKKCSPKLWMKHFKWCFWLSMLIKDKITAKIAETGKRVYLKILPPFHTRAFFTLSVVKTNVNIWLIGKRD